MAIAEVVISPCAKWAYAFPVSGAGSNIPVGTIMQAGATAGTNYSIAIPAVTTVGATAGGGTGNPIGMLVEPHNYSASGDALTQTLNSWWPNGKLASGKTQFPSRSIELLNVGVIFRMDYALSSATQVSVASATSTVITITSTEANLDGGWSYVVAGTGIGQLAFIKSSTTGAWTITANNTTLDSTSKLIKILPIFHYLPTFLVNTTTVPTLLDSLAAIGTARAVQLGQYMVRPDGCPVRLDPGVHDGLSGLSALANITFYSHMQMQNTIWQPIS